MDIIFFITGCLGLAETIDLFCNKDFLIFLTDSVDPADYDIKKVFAVEKWLFAVDTLALYGISFHIGGYYGDLFLLAVLFVTLILHWNVFKSPKYRAPGRTGNRKKDRKRGK